MVKNESNIFIDYTWRKLWVRPHESLFSVLLNFARVNVLGLHQALSMFSKISISEKYDSRNVIFHDCSKNGLQIAKEHLLPEDYIYGFNGILIDKQLFHSEFEQKLKLCPQCMRKFGYHSVLYQLKNVFECPIHHVPLEIIFDYSYKTKTRMFYFKKKDEFCISDIPLPVDRAEGLDISKISGYYNSLNNAIKDLKYIGTFCRTKDISNDSLSLGNLKETDLITTVRIDEGLDVEEYLAEEFLRLYITLYPDILEQIDEPDDYLINTAKNYMQGQFVEFTAYLFTMELISKWNTDSFPGTYPKPTVIDSNVYPNNAIYRRIAFAEIIRGCTEQFICSDIGFKHPCSSDARRYSKYDNMNYNPFNEYISSGLGGLKRSTIAYILAVALFDLYQYQWKRFERLTSDSYQFDKVAICNQLPDIRYIVIEDTYSNVRLYRQVGEKK